MIRKLLAVMVTLSLLCCGSIATATSDFDLSGLSYEELVSLRDRIDAILNAMPENAMENANSQSHPIEIRLPQT